jgi:predicted 2-oxoglutarate/Fe(II)-dependent dioxygenase YbiX
MDRGAIEPAAILQDGTRHAESVRLTSDVDVDAATLDLVESRLEERRANLTRWAGHPLGAREGAGFLRYGPGGFYRAHRDRGIDPSWPGAARRALAVVVFLNADFRGGILRLLDAGLDVVPSAGLLVAFPATMLHEVTPLESGTRDVVVDWFYQAAPPAAGPALRTLAGSAVRATQGTADPAVAAFG